MAGKPRVNICKLIQKILQNQKMASTLHFVPLGGKNNSRKKTTWCTSTTDVNFDKVFKNKHFMTLQFSKM